MNGNIKIFADQRLKVFACLPTKAPAVNLGFYAGSFDMENLAKQFHDDNFLIGFPTGQINYNIIVVDYDLNKPLETPDGKKVLNADGSEVLDTRTVDELHAEIEDSFGPLPDTFSVETPSGGLHRYYKYTGGVLNLNSARRFFSKALPIDIRANGGYVVTVDDKNYCKYDDAEETGISNLLEEIAEVPGWVIDHKKDREYSESTPLDNILPPEEIREIRSALTFLDSDDRDTWIRVGMALKSTGSPSAKGLWDEWSQKSDKYKAKDQEGRWKSLKPKDLTVATLFHEAKNSGWVTTYSRGTTPILSEPAMGNLESVGIISKRAKAERRPFPSDLLHPPGLVGEFAEYIDRKSIKSQPILSIGASLSAIGTLAGRKIQTDTGIRTNIYCLGVGVSGCGKEAARKVIKDCFNAAGCISMASTEDLASDSAIINSLKTNQTQIFLIDEIGRFLKTTGNAGSPHLYNIISVLLKLYSSSNSVFSGKSYADTTKRVIVQQPNVCLYGTTVPDSLYNGLTVENVVEGFLSRMIIFESEDPDPKKRKRTNLVAKPPGELIDKMKSLKDKKINYHPDGNLDMLNPNPQVVPISEVALVMLEEFDDKIRELREHLRRDNQIDTIYNRSSQLAEQIALIVAGGVDIENPVITEREMLYGINLIKYVADNMLYIVDNFIAENEYQHTLKKVLQIIRDHERISISALTRKTQYLQGYVRNDIIETLKSSEQIHEQGEGVGNNKKRIFVAL